MKMKILFACLCMIAFTSCSYHMYTKEEAIKVAKKRNLKKEGTVVIEDENKILKVLTRDSSYQKMDEIYYFNDDGKQIKYSVIAACDSCFQKYLLKAIANENYKWTKLNDSTYISKYSLKRMLNIHASTFSYDIVKNDRTKKEWELLRNMVKQ